MKKKYLLVGIAIMSTAVLYTQWQTPAPGEIPQKYQALYTELEQELDEFGQQLDSRWDKDKYQTTFGAELIVANGNRGTALLDEENYQYILLYLDRLEQLGVKGVKVTVGYPLLVSDFPHSNRYLDFYTKLSQEISEKRGLGLLVQSTALFTESEFSTIGDQLKAYYQDLVLEKYQQGKREQINKILTHLKPDYLTVETEPDTMAHNTGLKELNDPQVFRKTIKQQIEGVNRGNTLIGAGVGTWNDQSFAEEIVTIPNLDFFEMRIYPVVGEYLENALIFADLAKAHGKKIIMGESWLYKASEQEVKQGGAIVLKAFTRDTFSFWQPLDQKFLEILVKLAHFKQIEFVSPFWTKYFFGYSGYTIINSFKPPGMLLKQSDQVAIQNLLAGEYTQTGLTYQKLINNSIPPPPSTVPLVITTNPPNPASTQPQPLPLFRKISDSALHQWKTYHPFLSRVMHHQQVSWPGSTTLI